MSSYAVLWSEPRCAVEAGKLELGRRGLRFEGSHGSRGARVRRISYREIDGVRIGYKPPERLHGKPTLVVDIVEGRSLRIGSVNGVGTVAELADELARRRGR